MFTAAFLCSSFIAMPAVFADNEPTATTGVDVDVSVQPVISIRTLDSTGTTDISSLSIDIVPEDTGRFGKNSMKVQVDTTNITGYVLHMTSDYKTDGTTSETTPATQASYTNALVSTANNDTIPSISTTVSESDFSTTNSSYQNMWGVSKAWNETISGNTLSGGSITSYFGVPVHGSNIIIRDDVTTPAHVSTTDVGVGANVNTAKMSGTYNNRLVFTAVANPTEPPVCTANTICYLPNGDDVTGITDDQTTAYMTSTSTPDETPLSSSTTEFTLIAPNYVRPGYGFIGWNTEADGSGTMYGPNQTITTTDNSLTPAMQAELGSKGIALYAQWIASAGNMQNWSGCSSMSIGDVTALTDTRTDSINQNATYAIAKLVDGKCWMIENLRYAGTGTSADVWSSDHDTATFTMKQYNFTNLTQPDSDRAPVSGVYSSDPDGSRWYSYGSYYSWAGAINSTTNYGNDARSSAPGICPSGWKLPSAKDANADYGYLYTQLGNESNFTTSNNFRSYPNNFVFSGSWASTAYYRGVIGYLYSSMSTNSSYAYYLMFGINGVDSARYNWKTWGYPVRCIKS